MVHIFSTDFSNPLKSMSKLWATSDIIWKIAGDQSTDFNHYTKHFNAMIRLTEVTHDRVSEPGVAERRVVEDGFHHE